MGKHTAERERRPRRIIRARHCGCRGCRLETVLHYVPTSALKVRR